MILRRARGLTTRPALPKSGCRAKWAEIRLRNCAHHAIRAETPDLHQLYAVLMCLTFGRMGRLNTPGKQAFATVSSSVARRRGLLELRPRAARTLRFDEPTADFTQVPTVTVPCAGGCQVQDRGRMIQVPCAGLEKEHPDIEEITGNFTGETCGTGGCFIVSSELVRTYSEGHRNAAQKHVYRYKFSKYETTAVIDGGEVDSGATAHRGHNAWRVGELRPCWQRAAGVELSGAYSCGDDNPECLTLADPASVAGHLVGGMAGTCHWRGRARLRLPGLVAGICLRRAMLARSAPRRRRGAVSEHGVRHERL